MKLYSLSYHKKNCQCVCCKHVRGEKVIHKENCQCASCKSKRGDYRGENNPMYGNPREDLQIKFKNRKVTWGHKISKTKMGHKSYRKGMTLEEEYGKEKAAEKLKLMSKIGVRCWQNPEYVRKQMKSRHVKPNKAELELDDFLQQILPNEYKYVGDGEFILAGKCPDFININGQKKIIELYGDYWHTQDEARERIHLFRQYEYKTLIIWNSEIKDKNKLGAKILMFNDK